MQGDQSVLGPKLAVPLLLVKEHFDVAVQVMMLEHGIVAVAVVMRAGLGQVGVAETMMVMAAKRVRGAVAM